MPKEATIGETVFRKILRDELKGYATREDLRSFTTKDDLKSFATKEDLKNELKAYATKEDLKNELKIYATKEDLKPLATKEHLKMYAATKYDLEMCATKEEMRSLHNEVMNILDEMHGMLKRNTEELLVISNRVYRIHDPKIENHEKRITHLEVSVA